MKNSKSRCVPLSRLFAAGLGGVLFWAPVGDAEASPEQMPLVDRLLAAYDQVNSVSCLVRRETRADGNNTVRTLSRVFYQRPDKLHVETVSPFARRVVSDGEHFYDAFQGAPKGFRKPVAELDRERLIQLRKVPGTAMDHLFRLKGITPEALEPGPEGLRRYAYTNDQQVAVLSIDEKGRLVRLALYKSLEDEHPFGAFSYSAFKEVPGGGAIPCRHEGMLRQEGVEVRDTVRIENLEVNQPIPPSMFNPEGFFDDVSFTDVYLDMFED